MKGFIIGLGFILIGFSTLNAQDTLYVKEGTASFYAKKFHGRPTASGEIFHVDSLTAAHKKLPFGTIVKVTNLSNNKVVFVKINDRGMKGMKRIIDLSPAAARELGMINKGLQKVRVEEIR
ncbi:MAG: septal ring lytic transglycosylase RlpA family protein [Bacteroidia bacterium]